MMENYTIVSLAGIFAKHADIAEKYRKESMSR